MCRWALGCGLRRGRHGGVHLAVAIAVVISMAVAVPGMRIQWPTAGIRPRRKAGVYAAISSDT